MNRGGYPGHAPGIPSDYLIERYDASVYGTNTLIFRTIPDEFNALKFVFGLRGDNASNTVDLYMLFNEDTASSYFVQSVRCNGTTITTAEALATATPIAATIPADSAVAGSYGCGEIDIWSLQGNQAHQSYWETQYICRSGYRIDANTGNTVLDERMGVWQANAVTTPKVQSISFTLSAGGFAQNSLISMYGRL